MDAASDSVSDCRHPTVVVVPSFTTASDCVNAEHGVVFGARLLFLAGAIRPLPAGYVHPVVNEAGQKLQNAVAATATGLPIAELHNTELTLGDSPIIISVPGRGKCTQQHPDLMSKAEEIIETIKSEKMVKNCQAKGLFFGLAKCQCGLKCAADVVGGNFI
nr:unnamed protein product [Spirometra erinaceieuropaei]